MREPLASLDSAAVDALSERLAEERLKTTGFLSVREARFLAVLGVCVRAPGVILEIGSLMGLSTIILAKAASAAEHDTGVVAVDPLTSPAETDAPLDSESSRNEFFSNLDGAGVRDAVEFHEMLSGQLAKTWERAIRLLWIDGDHSLSGVQADFDNFAGHLSPGGFIAFHDVMHYGGVSRVFADRVLRSDLFGAAGVVGSIGWAQRRPPQSEDRHERIKRRMARRLDRHARWTEGPNGVSSWGRSVGRLIRSTVPHGRMKAGAFRALIAE